jgi:hypothetical protein
MVIMIVLYLMILLVIHPLQDWAASLAYGQQLVLRG